jgi:hypothetical protein
MDSTSVQRLRPPPLPRRAGNEGHPAADGLLERVVLFTVAFSPGRASALLQQLAGASREEALRHAERISALEPSARQGRVARAFGERPDAGERLRALMAEAGPRLARALRERMPPHHRVLFPEAEAGSSTSPEPTGAEALFASRLVKEATR